VGLIWVGPWLQLGLLGQLLQKTQEELLFLHQREMDLGRYLKSFKNQELLQKLLQKGQVQLQSNLVRQLDLNYFLKEKLQMLTYKQLHCPRRELAELVKSRTPPFQSELLWPPESNF
jgi:hypothetical protein